MSYGWTGHTPLPGSTKQAIRTRDRSSCQNCGDHGRNVDHIIPLAEGGTHAPDNLQTLCGPCHDAKTRTEQARGQRRRAERARHPIEAHPGLT